MIPGPWMLIVAGVAAVGLAAGGFTFGMKYESGQNAKAQQLVLETREQAQLGAAEAIAKIEIKNTTTQQQLDTVIRENTVYVDCVNDPNAMRLLNDALAGGSEPSGDRKLSATDATDR